MTDVRNEQALLWNGTAGQAWVEAQDMIDRLFEPLERLLVEAVGQGTRRALDIGCGTGATTVAVARRIASGGECTGIDISEPMIAAARERAERAGVAARFVCADAESYSFEPESFDRILSRFGVMFFGDPVRAFANLRHATREGGALDCIAWRGAGENPFMTTAERAAAPLSPNIPPRDPDAPGQFAFADRDKVRTILEASGWADIDIRPIDVPCVLPETELDRYLARFGPLGRALAEADEATRTRIVGAVRSAFDPYVHDPDVRFTAACWRIGARR